MEESTGGHPCGVQPWGSRLLDGSCADVRSTGLGRLAVLDDELLLSVLGLLAAKDLSRLAATNKALYCFAYHEPLWKALTVEEIPNFCYSSSWRETYIRTSLPGFRQRRQLRVPGMYSDVLYQSWHFAHAPLEEQWLQRDNLPRVDAADLTVEQFRHQFEEPNRPVVITGEVTKWLAHQQWSRQYLGDAFRGKLLNAGGCHLSFENYGAYAAGSRDDLPLYLFDKHCLGWRNAENYSLADDFKVPEVFAEDLFAVLGEQRPDYRWLIIGPAKSGSSFHKDPNSTSAWNAVISGSKKWVLWPPSDSPPGVYPSADGLEVSSPYTLHEWFANFYDFAQEAECAVEGICRAGELLFVPRGWWHLAVNLEETVAITQNFVSACNLPHVMRHLQQPHLISGCSIQARATLHDRFVAALQEHRPQVMQDLVAQEAKQKEAASKKRALSSLFGQSATTSTWSDVRQHDEEAQGSEQTHSTGAFSFGFSVGST